LAHGFGLGATDGPDALGDGKVMGVVGADEKGSSDGADVGGMVVVFGDCGHDSHST